MSVLTNAQATDAAAQAAKHLFAGQPPALGGAAVATINAGLDQILANAQALDSALDTTLTAAVAAVGGATTIINGLAAQLTAPVSGWTAQQKTILLCFVLMKRVGLI